MLKELFSQYKTIVDDLSLFVQGQKKLGLETLSSTETGPMVEILDHLIKNVPCLDQPSRATTPSLETVQAELGECTRCRLSQSRKKIVFGQGNPQAALVFVGEAPGKEEDLAGEPFVGEAGQLLTRIIEAIHLRREEVFITNVIKCRPPQNRDPEPEEIQICLPFLKQQLQIIRPRIICALGKFATQALLKTAEPISKLRGQLYEFQGIRLVPTFHPASLLRNPAWKRKVWEDMQLIEKLLSGKN